MKIRDKKLWFAVHFGRGHIKCQENSGFALAGGLGILGGAMLLIALMAAFSFAPEATAAVVMHAPLSLALSPIASTEKRRSLALAERRDKLVDEVGTILAKVQEDKREATDDERKIIDATYAQIDTVNDDIKRWQRFEDEKSGDRTASAATPLVEVRDAKKFRTFGEQLQAVARAEVNPRDIDPRLVQSGMPQNTASGMSSGAPSDGGFLVQKEFVDGLLKRTYELGQVSTRVNKIPISNPNADGIKLNAVDEQSRVNGSRWGGIQMYWIGEADAFTATKPKFRQMELNLHDLTGACYATRQLLADAAALETVIQQGFSEEMNFKVEDAIINGTGAGMPLGIMNAGCRVSVAKETNQAAGTVVFENIVKMWARCWGRSRMDAAWLINQDVEPQLYSLSLAVGTGGVPVYMPAGGLSDRPFGSLFGRPVIPVEYAATAGTEGDIILGDFSQYVMIDKGALEADSSIHVRFLNNENTFRFIYRADGQPFWNTALTPKNGTNTLSPFVTLASR